MVMPTFCYRLLKSQGWTKPCWWSDTERSQDFNLKSTQSPDASQSHPYVFTHPLCHRQDVTQDQLLSEVELI